MPAAPVTITAYGPPVQLSYDAVADKSRRQPPRVRLLAEDDQLGATDRKKLVATTRDLPRNFAVAAWAIRRHIDYVASFSFQSRTGDAGLDREIETLVRRWSHKANFDASGRHGLHRALRLAEIRRTVDGDVFFQKLTDGRVAAIEGDRIRTPTGGGLPDWVDRRKLTHGVLTTPAGRARAYCLCNRKRGMTGYEFARMLPARYVLAHGYYDRFDQVRGISPLAPALNTLQDCYENFDLALAKAKVAQLFALAFYREADEAAGEPTYTGDDATGGGDDDKGKYAVDFGRGPVLLDLEPGDRAEFLESKQPAGEFQKFTDTMISIALKSLDIPYSFFNESFTNYSGARQALLIYEQSAKEKRRDNRELLDALTRWRAALWILDGTLELPRNLTVADLRWEWQPAGLPWIDPLKEVKADREAIDGRLTSRQRILKRHGLDFYDVLDELAAEEAAIAEKLGADVRSDAAETWTVNERRRYAGLPPIEGGDAIFLPSSKIPTIDINEEPQ